VLVPLESVDRLAKKLSQQRGITVDFRVIPGADHFFSNGIERLTDHVEDYLEHAVTPAPRLIMGERRAAV
jgi:uncharacterized protein